MKPSAAVTGGAGRRGAAVGAQGNADTVLQQFAGLTISSTRPPRPPLPSVASTTSATTSPPQRYVSAEAAAAALTASLAAASAVRAASAPRPALAASRQAPAAVRTIPDASGAASSVRGGVAIGAARGGGRGEARGGSRGGARGGSRGGARGGAALVFSIDGRNSNGVVSAENRGGLRGALRGGLGDGHSSHRGGRGGIGGSGAAHVRRPSPGPGPSSIDKLTYIRRKFNRFESGAWDCSQFLYELVGDDSRHEKFRACFSDMSEPGSWRLLEVMLPTLSSRDIIEALNALHSNRIFTQLVSSGDCQRAWDTLAEKLPAAPTREYVLGFQRVLFHLLGLVPTRFYVLQRCIERVGQLETRLNGGPSADVAEGGTLLRARLAHSLSAEAEAEEAALAAEQASRTQVGRGHGRNLGPGHSTDAELEDFARTWRKLPPYPTRNDIFDGDEGLGTPSAVAEGDPEADDIAPTLVSRPVLPHNRAQGSFPSLPAYLSTHYRLLREDAFAALRAGLRRLHADVDEHTIRRETSCSVYRNVRVVAGAFTRYEVGWRVRFELPHRGRGRGGRGARGGRGGAANGQEGPPMKVGDMSRRLTRNFLNGSLLCLVATDDADCHDLIFATVINRNDGLFDDKNGPFVDIQEVVPEHAEARFDTSRTYSLVESAAYYEAFRPVLEALLAISDDGTQLPFSDVLLGGRPASGAGGRSPPATSVSITPPLYLLAPGASRVSFKLSARHLASDERRDQATAAAEPVRGKAPSSAPTATDSKLVNVLSTTWPSWVSADFSLNASQLAAVQLALRNRVAIIQGPPGCGKTYVGVLLTRLLLANRKMFKERPILFVCFTNHALDQLLEHVSDYTSDIVRVGGRSKSEKLDPFSLQALRRKQTNRDNPDNKRLNRSFAMAMGNMEYARNEVLAGLSGSAAVELDWPALQESQFAEIGQWAVLQARSLSSKSLLTTSTSSVPMTMDGEEDDEGEFVTVGHGGRHRPAKRKSMDLVGRWLHSRLIGRKIVVGATALEPDDDETPAQRNERLAEEADAREEEARRMEEAEILNRGPVQRATVVDERALRAALLVSEGANADNNDDEGAYSDEDIPGDGPARARARKGQRRLTDAQLEDVRDVWSLSISNRRALYSHWLRLYRDLGRHKVSSGSEAIRHAGMQLRAIERERDGALLRNQKVIGFTTTGAAKMRELLALVRPAVLIVEEAAEVLEAHVLASLVPSLEHLVLIGDHQQLRPKVENFDLQRRHQLNVSMFERLVNNGVPHVTLDTQHRMRPEFSRLLRPTIYRTLHDAPSTRGRPPIQGLRSNLFFLNHDEPETSAADRGGVGGFSNKHEAAMCVSLVEYLIRNGRRPEDIVVLVAYQSQATLVRTQVLEHIDAIRAAVDHGGGGSVLLGIGALDAAPSASSRPAASAGADRKPAKRGLAAVRISTIDNYQGEEAEIVVLCLVRSAPTTPKSFKGFMRESNRICVALSRARSGFFVLGNADLHRASSPVWLEIVEKLAVGSEIGSGIPLACHRHPENATLMRKPQDWASVPSGGCLLPCGERLECGHVCPQCCHPDSHDGLRCTKPCSRPRECGHACVLPCFRDCGSCHVMVKHEFPLCGHKTKLPCSVDVKMAKCKMPCPVSLPCGHPCPLRCGDSCPYSCPLLVDKPVPSCPRQHTVSHPCGVLVPPEVSCGAKCGEILECGHHCPEICSTCTEKGKDGNERSHAPCSYDCQRRLSCGHDCAAKHPCSEPCPLCMRKCETRCEHSTCPLPCSEPCTPCSESCRVRCKHSACKSLCGMPCEREACDVACTKTLEACGHACIGLCGEPCPTLCRICNGDYCDTLTQTILRDSGPDERFLQLQDCGHLFEVSMLDGWMAAQDISRRPPNSETRRGADDGGIDGTDDTQQGGGRALQLPRCPGCRTPVRRSFRYSGLVRRCLLEMEEVKRRNWVGPELRSIVLAELQRVLERSTGKSAAAEHRKHAAVRKELSRQITDLEARKIAHPRAATVHLLLGELKLRVSGATARSSVALPSDEAAAAERERDATRGAAIEHFNECLRLVGFTDRGVETEARPTCEPALTSRQRAGQAHFALLHVGLAMAHTPELAHAARLRLEASDRAADSAGISTKVDVELALRDVAAVEQELVKRAMEGVEKGSWHICPNGHRYLIGECGGATQQSKCPDCRADVGGSGHRLLASNRSLGVTPWDRAAHMVPDAALIARVERGELDGAGHH